MFSFLLSLEEKAQPLRLLPCIQLTRLENIQSRWSAEKGGISDSEREVDVHGRSLGQPLAGSCVSVHMCVSVCTHCVSVCTHVRECVHAHVHAQRETIKPLMVS